MSARIHLSAPATVAAALTLSASLALTGCFGAPGIPGVPGIPGAGAGSDEQQAEDFVEGMLDQMGDQAEGEFDMSTGELPEGFPADVPVTGTPTMGFAFSDDTGTGWNVSTETAGPADSVMAAIDGQLTGAGFSSEFEGFYESDAYSVVVFVAEQDGGVSVTYTVVVT